MDPAEVQKLREQLGLAGIERELARIIELISAHRGSWHRRRRAYDDLILDEDDEEDEY